eukprot:CAMPEP_0168483472 /NCGR_PEP_ID=MMETSP0228-20121227/65588_1 /TAXON_ID=133427 /ORGANISM="Protoceratium reticulatum, Strain CCCM 535 (=CCMP 1889)" /LENGTH=290 /DNA_ID=CAMNT_0008499959 /DNA_START=40 /DNA_END=908 /DNA_ORIENTATION=-
MDPTIRSELYTEDAQEAGHGSVWGSWYDKASKRWGYACCRVTQRGQPCPLSLEKEVKQTKYGFPTVQCGLKPERKPVSWADGPPEFLPRSDFGSSQRFITHFLRFVLGQWRQMLAGGLADSSTHEHVDSAVQKTFRSEEMLRQTEAALAPLVHTYEDDELLRAAQAREQRELERRASVAKAGSNILKYGGIAVPDNAPEMSMQERLEGMASCAYERDYAMANLHYIKLTLGNKKWHNAYHGGEGKMNTGFKLHTVSASDLTSFDRDETVNNYIRGFRRALLFCQMVRPNA